MSVQQQSRGFLNSSQIDAEGDMRETNPHLFSVNRKNMNTKKFGDSPDKVLQMAQTGFTQGTLTKLQRLRQASIPIISAMRPTLLPFLQEGGGGSGDRQEEQVD